MTATKQTVTKQIAAKQIAAKQVVTKKSAAKWGAALHIPDAVTIGGQDWNVRRAWPAGDSRIAWEASLPGQGIRVGYLDERGVTVLDADRDPKLPGLARLLADGGRLVSHRPGKRAVVRLRDGSFAKCVRDGKASAVIAGQRRAAGFLPGFALPQVLSSDSSTVVLSVVPGVELHDPARLGAEWSRAWAESLDAWAQAEPHPTGTVTTAATRLPTAMPFHGTADEVEVLHLWRERARPLLETTRTVRGETLLADVDELIAEVTVELDDGAASARDGSIGLIHRDLHDKQIMWDPVSGPGLLDVDTACRGERALDLGNLCAHARWRTEQGLWTSAEAAVVIDEIARVASAAGIDPARVSAYEHATLIRLACVYAFRPAWSDRIGWLLEAAQAM
ncbi:MAG: phosphotransferase [Brevibacterium sp.]|uniref:Phosphotransferase enzyme family protein n=2 Tax=Brevibacterium linens TaxID=1703 RepID=A0A2H1J150_BRELN|nr:phosphotransferase [Brevibacterium linens]SMX80334.1 Phosphotransferase enzyme family protein [Brevibacterium linens ATCC 9172]SMX81197.1 Phosphotransferase enzyme family protein [Brevibacterium linens]